MSFAIPKGIDIPTRRELAAQDGGSGGFFVDAKLVNGAPLAIECFELLNKL